jgi:hypothetical protein
MKPLKLLAVGWCELLQRCEYQQSQGSRSKVGSMRDVANQRGWR